MNILKNEKPCYDNSVTVEQFEKVIKFIKKYELWILIIFAIAMNLSENIFGIDGLNDIGTVFFLIAIISLSMKKFMNKNN